MFWWRWPYLLALRAASMYLRNIDFLLLYYYILIPKVSVSMLQLLLIEETPETNGRRHRFHTRGSNFNFCGGHPLSSFCQRCRHGYCLRHIEHVHAFRKGLGTVVLEALMLHLLCGRGRKATMVEMAPLLAADR